ncbi:MAG: ATP-binding protein [Burkholderiaceae bacterium]|jgi:two-component system osmolarity sensor histidine kinase EnvZ|nr:ATP-binding protein [Burkholderiaceae bacterium]
MNLRSPSLFWRTFLLIVLLILASLAAWVQSFRVFEREPRARQIAQQVVSIVNITRSALLYSDPALRRDLLVELADNEGIRIVPLEAADQVQEFPDVPLLRMVREQVVAELGPQTRLAAAVNAVPGNWVSFTIEGDAYWVYIERDPLTRDSGTQWIRWAIMAMLLSLAAAIAITRVVNQPLARLSRAARELGAGHVPAPLPEKGPVEIRTVNQSFNRMVADLGKLEQDRAVLLAGISHDLRTPLTRLRLELEINDLPPETRAAMAGDIEQMDSIVRQFLDYARREPQQPAEPIDLSALVHEAMAHARLDATVREDIASDVRVCGYRTELVRALDNLLTNASRYGRDDAGRLTLDISLAATPRDVVLAVTDHGTGISPDQVDRLLRPFERGDSARSGSTGAGLGLAIVDRIARLHRASFELLPNQPTGLTARLVFPR